MEDKNKFLQQLEDIKDFAAVNERTITLSAVKEFFEEEELSVDQLEMVCAYLESNEITVQGHKSVERDIELFRRVTEQEPLEEDSKEPKEVDESKEAEQFGEEEHYLNQYLEELQGTSPLLEEEKDKLFTLAKGGDSLAKSRLIEGMLLRVTEVAKEYTNRGLLLSDLIQEGNIGLMLGVEELSEVLTEEIEEFLEHKIRLSMKEAIAENKEISKAADDVLIKSNVIHEGAKLLAEELERSITIGELAKYLQMEEYEIEEILEISKDPLPIKKEEEKEE